jgi:hypothetical protein
MEENNNLKFAIFLTAYEWGLLLNELKFNLKFINSDKENTIQLYEQIATQLNNGVSVKVHVHTPLSWPKNDLISETDTSKPIPLEIRTIKEDCATVAESKKPWYRRLF